MPIRKTKDSEYLNPNKEAFRCKICDDDYYTKYKDFENTCFVCAIKSKI
jgi:hypothetical protein